MIKVSIIRDILCIKASVLCIDYIYIYLEKLSKRLLFIVYSQSYLCTCWKMYVVSTYLILLTFLLFFLVLSSCLIDWSCLIFFPFFLFSPHAFKGIFDVFKVYLFWSERERQSASMVGAETEGDTESKAGSRLWAVNTELNVGLKPTIRESMTHELKVDVELTEPPMCFPHHALF